MHHPNGVGEGREESSSKTITRDGGRALTPFPPVSASGSCHCAPAVVSAPGTPSSSVDPHPPQSDSVLFEVPAAPGAGKATVPQALASSGRWRARPGLAGAEITEASLGAEAQSFWQLLPEEDIENSTKGLLLQICEPEV